MLMSSKEDSSEQTRRGFLRNLSLGAGLGIPIGAAAKELVDDATESRESQTIIIDHPEAGEIDGRRDLVENYSETVQIDNTKYVVMPSSISVSGQREEEQLIDDDGIEEYDEGDGAGFRVYEADDIEGVLSGEAKEASPVYESEMLEEGEYARFDGMFGNKIRVELLEAGRDSEGSSALYHLSWEEESEDSFWS